MNIRLAKRMALACTRFTIATVKRQQLIDLEIERFGYTYFKPLMPGKEACSLSNEGKTLLDKQVFDAVKRRIEV